MFTGLRMKLAVQFTAIVFVLMLLTGVVFIAIEYYESHSTLDQGLVYSALIASDIYLPIDDREATWLRQRDAAVRITGPDGSLLYEADVFARLRVPDGPDGFSSVRLGTDTYRIYTTPLPEGGRLQLAALDRIGVAQLQDEARLFFGAALFVSLLTFLTGLFFAQKSLEPAKRMFARLEQFTHDASHELRTPLAVMNSELDLALRTGEYERGILAAKTELRRGSDMVDDLLRLASLDSISLKAEPLDLSGLVEDEIARFGPLADECRISVRGEVAPGIRTRGDARLIAELMATLLANALKFTPEGGEITVTLTHAQLRVADTGPGIAADDLERVFERFYQTDSSRAQAGHGLGLAIARRIAEVHGWSIKAESGPGLGATFVISLRG